MGLFLFLLRVTCIILPVQLLYSTDSKQGAWTVIFVVSPFPGLFIKCMFNKQKAPQFLFKL